MIISGLIEESSVDTAKRGRSLTITDIGVRSWLRSPLHRDSDLAAHDTTLVDTLAVVWRSMPKGALASVAKSLSLEDEVKSHDGQADKAHSMELSRQRSTAVMDDQLQRTASVKR